jgi:DNA-directed RNA polymerase III subunit RPC11
MWFCPLDGTLLQIMVTTAAGGGGTGLSSSSGGASMFVCRTCPYSCAIDRNFSSQLAQKERKQVDDILGGAAAWENVDRTMTVCPDCSNTEAYFMQMQIRSADEPMSVFYKCCKCSHQWNDK